MYAKFYNIKILYMFNYNNNCVGHAWRLQEFVLDSETLHFYGSVVHNIIKSEGEKNEYI